MVLFSKKVQALKSVDTVNVSLKVIADFPYARTNNAGKPAIICTAC